MILLKAIGIAVILILFPVFSGVVVSVAEMQAPAAQFTQAIFMILPAIIFVEIIIYIKRKYIEEAEVLEAKENPRGLVLRKKAQGMFAEYGMTMNVTGKKLLWFLPSLIVLVPLLTKGFKELETSHLLAFLALYVAVGISEEIYYRGIVMHILEKQFNAVNTVWIASLIFGVGHAVVGLSGVSVQEVFLTIINAIAFGLLASSLYKLMGTIYPLMLLHFLFDFESKVVAGSAQEIFILEIIRGAILTVLAIAAFVVVIVKESKGGFDLEDAEKEKMNRTLDGITDADFEEGEDEGSRSPFSQYVKDTLDARKLRIEEEEREDRERIEREKAMTGKSSEEDEQ